MSPKKYTDEYGTWEIYPSGVRALIEPSQKWLDEHPAPEPTPDEPDEPTPAPTVWDELAAAYQEGVNSIDE
jgi:hypothetical protein